MSLPVNILNKSNSQNSGAAADSLPGQILPGWNGLLKKRKFL